MARQAPESMLDDHHHGATHLSVWLPQPYGAQEALIVHDPARFFRPAYVGARGWVGVVLDDAPDWELVAELVREGFRLVAPRELAAQLPPRRGGGPGSEKRNER
jgi:hypothetical protein